MSSIDVEALLAPVSDESPAGDDLEYDPEFGELERSAQFKPEQVMGDEVIPAEEPDWRAVRDLSEPLFARTKDLRVAAHLTNSATRLEGFEATADGLTLIERMLTDFWEGVHPLLDEDDGDPIIRMNALLSLTDEENLGGALLKAPVVESRAVGRFSLRDVHIAKGEASPVGAEKENPPNMGIIDAAFMDVDIEALEATGQALATCVEKVDGILSACGDKVESLDVPNLASLKDSLGELDTLLKERLARRGVGDGVADAGDDAEMTNGSGGAGMGGVGGVPGEIRSREDVIRTIDKLCDYFNAYEPSSPVPIVLKRAQRLVNMNFMEILQDMTPDGVSQAEVIAGSGGSDSYSSSSYESSSYESSSYEDDGDDDDSSFSRFS